MILLYILSVFIHCVSCNTEKAFVSSHTAFPLVNMDIISQVNVNESPLEFPYTKLTFQGDFGDIPNIDAYYILQNIQDQYGEVRVSWAATIPLDFKFSFLTINSTKFVKLSVTKSGISKHGFSYNHLEFTLTLEKLYLQVIPVSFIPVLVEILLSLTIAWRLYPILLNFIHSKND